MKGKYLILNRSCTEDESEAFRMSFNSTEKALPRAVSCVEKYDEIKSSMELIQLVKVSQGVVYDD